MSRRSENIPGALVDVRHAPTAVERVPSARDTGSARTAGRWIGGVALVELACIAGTAYLASIFYHRVLFGAAPPQHYIVSSLLLGFCFVLICLTDDQYETASEKWTRRGISRAMGALALAFVFFLSLSFLFKLTDDYSRGTFLTQIAFVFPVLLLTRTYFVQRMERAVEAGQFEGRKLIVVSLSGTGRHSELAQNLGKSTDRIVRWHDLAPKVEPADALVRRLAAIRGECRAIRADVVVIIFDAAEHGRLAPIVEALYELPANIQLLPIGLAPYMRRTRISESGHVHVLEINSQPTLFDRALKGATDLIVAAAAVLLLAPLFVLVALAIKLESRGPILFRQIRHGFNNEPIEVLKFRTMVVAENQGFRQAVRDDPRVTRIGYLLRRTNIDELPQLFNVIRGDMSLVGPRPHALEHNEAFAENIKWLHRRHRVKPGITGWAQVNGFRGATDTHDKMQRRIEYDLYYVDNWSFFFDVKILLMTLFSRKAYSNAY